MTSILHKVKDAVTPDKHDKPTHSANTGPHGSNIANKLDPRVDSDRGTLHFLRRVLSLMLTGLIDNRATTGGATGTTTSATGAAYGHTGHTGYTGTTGTTGTTGHTGYTGHTGHTGYTGHTGTTGSTNVGPHSSNVANMADPRVTRDPGPYGTTGGVTAGGARNVPSGSTNAGPHDSNIANRFDPRVDSDRDNRARHHGLGGDNAPAGTNYTTPGTGRTQQTAGPHNSNLANKLDPRVDSDLDNSRTVGNATRY